MIQIFILSQYNDYFGTDEYYYQNYIDQFGDRIDDQTDEKLQNEEQRIAALYTELETTENSVTAYKLQQELECEGGFQRYADRVRELREDGRSPPSPEGCTIYTFIYQYTLVAFLGHPALYVFCLSCDFGFLQRKGNPYGIITKIQPFRQERKLFILSF